jgi:hypothetical protein
MLSSLLIAGLLLAAAPAQPSDPFQWEVPELVSKVEVPARMNMEGMPIRLQVYTSRQTVEQLLQHFATAFDEAGFYIERNPRQFAAQPHFTALDTKTYRAYTVILEREPNGLTTVVLGEARLGEARAPAASASPLLYPGAQGTVQGDFEGARTVAYQVAGKQAEVEAWYREQLTRAGYKEESPLLFRRDEQEIHVSLTQNGGWVHAALFLKTAPASSQ